MKKGIIFDLDGTLWDATEQMLPAWNKVLLRYAPDREPMTLEEVRSFMGKTVAEIAAAALPNFPEEERVEVFNRCSIEELPWLREHPGSIYPKVPEILYLLSKEYPLYIVSNCQAGYIEAFLKVTNLGKYVTDFENPGRTGKPKADNIRLVIERNNLDKAFYVGDTQGDYDATMAAGIPFIFAAYGFGNIDGDEEEIQGLNELPDLIDKLVEK